MIERRAKLLSLIESSGAKTDEWGTGSTKTIEHLLNEILEGECILVEEDGQLYRDVRLASIRVYYRDKDSARLLKLIEDRQVFDEGTERQRVRKREIDSSISEKLHQGEKPEDAFHRALEEELSIRNPKYESTYTIDKDTRESESYPGVMSRYSIYKFDVFLNDEDYKPEGYIEIQPDKTTYFTWLEVN